MELAPDPARDERAKRRVLASPLEWKERREPVDPEEIYFTTIAAFRESAWSRWSEDVRAILIDRQASKGCAVSSWDPAGERAKRGGRVGSTATMTLALALTWRYPKVFR
jgi:hypothetical protein